MGFQPKQVKEGVSVVAHVSRGVCAERRGAPAEGRGAGEIGYYVALESNSCKDTNSTEAAHLRS